MKHGTDDSLISRGLEILSESGQRNVHPKTLAAASVKQQVSMSCLINVFNRKNLSGLMKIPFTEIMKSRTIKGLFKVTNNPCGNLRPLMDYNPRFINRYKRSKCHTLEDVVIGHLQCGPGEHLLEY